MKTDSKETASNLPVFRLMDFPKVTRAWMCDATRVPRSRRLLCGNSCVLFSSHFSPPPCRPSRKTRQPRHARRLAQPGVIRREDGRFEASGRAAGRPESLGVFPRRLGGSPDDARRSGWPVGRRQRWQVLFLFHGRTRRTQCLHGVAIRHLQKIVGASRRGVLCEARTRQDVLPPAEFHFPAIASGIGGRSGSALSDRAFPVQHIAAEEEVTSG